MNDQITASGYQANVVGRCLYDMPSTRDFDISYTGAHHDPRVLLNLLNNSVAAGLETDLLVDARWDSNPVTATYRNGTVEISPDNFIFLDYYEEDNGLGSRIIRNYALNPKYTVYYPGLVASSHARVQANLKPHQVHAIHTYGQLPYMPLSNFINAK
jgi:hypothetical protein